MGNEGRVGFAGEPAQRVRQEAEETRRQRRLRLDGARGIGEPRFADLADQTDRSLEFVGEIAGLFARLRRLEGSRQRSAALLDEPRHIIGEALEIGLRRIGVGRDFREPRRERGEGRMDGGKAGSDGRWRGRGGGRGVRRVGGVFDAAPFLLHRGLRPGSFLVDPDGCLDLVHLSVFAAAPGFAWTHGVSLSTASVFLAILM